MSDYIYYDGELYHAEKGYVKPDHKYIKREPKGDGYRYYYDDIKKSVKNTAKDQLNEEISRKLASKPTSEYTKEDWAAKEAKDKALQEEIDNMQEELWRKEHPEQVAAEEKAKADRKARVEKVFNTMNSPETRNLIEAVISKNLVGYLIKKHFS